jgi:Bacterial membrane protein YfhO
MRLSIFIRQNRIHYKNYLLLLLICLLTYWPLTFGIFSVKNDAIHYFLPYRFNISEALRNGEWPFWSPYIYLGNPILGDMQSGAWNPVVWIFSALGRYDLTLFHYETLLYIFLGGIGMYKLTNLIIKHPLTALLIAVAYMLSGFMLSGQLINWLSAAAFIPFVIYYYLLTLHTSLSSNAIKTGIALFFLFTSCYPSFFILTAYLLLILFMSAIINRFRKKGTAHFYFGKFLLQHLLIAVVFAGLSLPAIISFIDLLPYYQRGGGTNYFDSVANGFEAQHFLSLLFPFTIKANDIVSATDVTCRNIYFGIFPLLILFVFPPAASQRNIKLFLLAVFSILFSLGDATPLRKICYKFIPLMDTFRHPSQMRLFFILAILLLGAKGLKKILSAELSTADKKKIRIFSWATAGMLLTVFIIAFSHSEIMKLFSLLKNTGLRSAFKNIIEAVSLNDAVALNGAFQLLFIAMFVLWLKKILASRSLFSVIWVTNLFIMAQLVLPASFVSKTSPREINDLVHSSPQGFPITNLENSLAENSNDAFENFNTIGLSYFYNKKIGISPITNSPSFLLQQDEFIQNDILYHYVSALPVVYIADSVLQLKDTALLKQAGICKYAFINEEIKLTIPCNEKTKAIVKKISANCFEIETETDKQAFLVLCQNYYHHWKVFTDGKPGKIFKTNISFMGTAIAPGNHTIIFKFDPANTIRAMWVQLAIILTLIITGIYSLIKKQK